VDAPPFPRAGQSADGKRRLQVTGERLTTGAGEVDRVAIRDITAITGAAREAEAARDRYAAILDSLPIPVWTRRGDLGVAYCNAAYARAVDAPRDEPLARGLEFPAGSDRAGGK